MKVLKIKKKYANTPEMLVLKCIRKSRNLRYTDVEKELGIKSKSYSAIEKGIRNIKIEELILIYKIYDINPWFCDNRQKWKIFHLLGTLVI